MVRVDLTTSAVSVAIRHQGGPCDDQNVFTLMLCGMLSHRTAERRAEFLANHDMLTGLANRLLFENRLAHERSRSPRTGHVVAVFAIDLDAFKAVNDRLGHPGGYRVVKRTAHLLSSCVRGDDLVARIGGDEFAIIQVSRSQPAAAEALISRIFKEISESSDEGIAIAMSIGVALSEAGQTGDDIQELADVALYRAKADGRNIARILNNHLKDEDSLRVRLSRDLENAISANELYLAFQPIANAFSLEIVAYEALFRWRRPSLGDMTPDVFVPVAGSTGLIGSIGSWVIDQALRAASTWDPKLSLAINLSRCNFAPPGWRRRYATPLALECWIRQIEPRSDGKCAPSGLPTRQRHRHLEKAAGVRG